jgi:hypothetical protein
MINMGYQMQCDYIPTPYPCPLKAHTVVIYGCLNMHIWERTLCQTHYDFWVSDLHRTGALCKHTDCMEPIDSYNITPANQVNPWLLSRNIRLREEATINEGTDPAADWWKILYS